MLKTLFGAVLAGALGIAGAASAQTFPTRPMTMVIPFAAGGPTDVLGRVDGAAHERDPRPAGRGRERRRRRRHDRLEARRRAAPDGYTFVLGTVGTHAQNQTLYKKPLYDAATDFTPVGADRRGADRADHAQGPAGQAIFKEFVAYAKANQDKMQFGSAGAGSATHLGCVAAQLGDGHRRSRTCPTAAPARRCRTCIGGRIDYLCEIVSTAQAADRGRHRQGASRSMTKARSPVLPDLPTAHEQGPERSRPIPGTPSSCRRARRTPIVEEAQRRHGRRRWIRRR